MGMSKNCEYCGESFTPARTTGKRQRFCAEPCQRAWWSENQEIAGKKFTFTCGHCEREYKTRHSDRNQYCSRECAYADIDSWSRAYKQLKKLTCLFCSKEFEGYKTSSKGYCSDECREKRNQLTCEYCGIEFNNSLPFTKYCSLDCQIEANKQMKRDQYEPKPLFIAECKVCGNEYETNRPQSKCCSEECSICLFQQRRVEAHQRRRARKKGVMVKVFDRQEIFERDGWSCQICGKKVNQTLRHPHPHSPSLDHVLPLANGGTHEPRNVQLAHLICNSTKSNIQPDQLRLL